MKQGFETTHPERAAMATAAMKFLADGDAKFEVRSEAARALGLMQITTAVRKYNYPLVAHSVGALLAADLGTQINLLIPERMSRSAAGKAATAPDAAKASARQVGQVGRSSQGQSRGEDRRQGEATGASGAGNTRRRVPGPPNAIKAQIPDLAPDRPGLSGF